MEGRLPSSKQSEVNDRTWGKDVELSLDFLADYYGREAGTGISTYPLERPGSPYTEFNHPRAFPFESVGGPSMIDNFVGRIRDRNSRQFHTVNVSHAQFLGTDLGLTKRIELLRMLRSEEVAREIYTKVSQQFSKLSPAAFAEIYNIISAFDTLAPIYVVPEWGNRFGRKYNFKEEGFLDNFSFSWFLRLGSRHYAAQEMLTSRGVPAKTFEEFFDTPFYGETIANSTKERFYTYIGSVLYTGDGSSSDDFWERLHTLTPNLSRFLINEKGINLVGASEQLDSLLNQILGARAQLAFGILKDNSLGPQ